jgi:hypothetical protein
MKVPFFVFVLKKQGLKSSFILILILPYFININGDMVFFTTPTSIDSRRLPLPLSSFLNPNFDYYYYHSFFLLVQSNTSYIIYTEYTFMHNRIIVATITSTSTSTRMLLATYINITLL